MTFQTYLLRLTNCRLDFSHADTNEPRGRRTNGGGAGLPRPPTADAHGRPGAGSARRVTDARTAGHAQVVAAQDTGTGGTGDAKGEIERHKYIKFILIPLLILLRQIDAKLTPGQPGGEGILANFFNSLLHKKAGTPGSPNVSLDGSSNFNSMPPTSTGGRSSSVTRAGSETPIEKMRTDAAAELDRLSRSTVKKEIDFSQPETTQSDC